MMYSTYKLNKQSGNIQHWRTPFPIWNQSVVPCPVLTVASWPAYKFLKRQIRWKYYWRRQWYPTPVLLPGKSHEWRSLEGYAHGVAKSQTLLSNFTFPFHFHALEKDMATHSSVLTLRIPGSGEPGGLPSMGSHRVGHDWSDLAAAQAVSIIMGIKVPRLWS